MSAEIRFATPEECARKGMDDALTIGWVLEKDGEPVGKLFATFDHGSVVGHGWEVESDNPFDALRLWKRAKQDLKKLGFTEVFIHFKHSDHPRVREMWERQGYEQVMTIYRGDI